ncbi:MAG: hypothetical protein KDA80_08675 [Planctomycetaceae bacterium]|nr:hypothetical protein [Planctomycetaceae bacterium]
MTEPQRFSGTTSLIPGPFAFRFTFPVLRVDGVPRAKAPLLSLPDECRIAIPSAMERDVFADVRLGWNPEGLALEVRVEGKDEKTICNPDRLDISSAIHLMIDTRDTQTIHRASRFCHLFTAMPAGVDSDEDSPMCVQRPIARAREDAPLIDTDLILKEGEITKTSWRLGLWFPKDSLHGFDPEPRTRLGFYLFVTDREMGHQYLTVTGEFPFDSDPSLWCSLELAE